MFSLSITIQASATLLIAWRIWSTHVKNGTHSDRMIVSVMWIVLESGMVLSSVMVIFLALYLLETAAAGLVESIVAQLDVCLYITSILLV